MADIVLDGITLPGDLVWEDEFQWSVIARPDSPEFSLGGAVILEESAKLAGRPITLVAKDEFLGSIWLSRTTILALQEKVNAPSTTMSLVMSDYQTFSVRFIGKGVTATPVYHIAPPIDQDRYYLTISLITVA